MFSGELDLDPSLLFNLPVRPGLRSHSFIHPFQYRLPTDIITTPSANAFKPQLVYLEAPGALEIVQLNEA